MIDPQQPDYSNTPASDRRAAFDYRAADAQRDPLITIVTPFFNTGALFHETARTVFRQSLQQWEWLIVNDASSHAEALEVLAQYRNSDDRIRVIDLAVNGGPSRARNIGFAQARARYVLQLDSDNLLEPTAAEKWWWFLETHPNAAFVKGFSVGFDAQSYLWRDGFHTADAFLTSNPVDATSLVRVAAHHDAGGYDEAMRDGLEDWDFWMRCAAAGHWGDTVPEFLDWYRRRPNHNDRWSEWDGGARQKAFVASLPTKFPSVMRGGFPPVASDPPPPNATLNLVPSPANRLAKHTTRLLLIAPWLAMGGSDKFNLDLIEQLADRGWEITVATTLDDSSWLSHFTRLTPDVFVLPTFLRTVDYPRFLLYLLESRQIDVVLVAHSELGYHLLPFLRARAPHVTFVEYGHILEEAWNDGGYPRLGVQYGACLDLSIVSSQALARWMVNEGADSARVSVCYTGGRVVEENDLQRTRESIRRQLELGESETLLLYPARLSAQKQPQVFAEVMRLLAQEGLTFSCLVAGDGPERGWLGTFLKRHRLGRQVRLLGAVSPDRMSELMAAADICFLPSTHEGIALTLYEAMAHGTVFVGADVGGQREVADTSTAILLPRLHDVRREASAYAQALSTLIGQPETVRRLGCAAREHIKHSYSIEQMVAGMEAAFAHARRLHDQDPRPVIPTALGDLAAIRAIEHDRLSKLAEELWRLASGQPPPSAAGGGWRFWLFRQCTWLEPAYAWGVKRGWRWLPAARERIRTALAS